MKRTTLDVDEALAEAAELLGTRSTAETIHEALSKVVQAGPDTALGWADVRAT